MDRLQLRVAMPRVYEFCLSDCPEEGRSGQGNWIQWGWCSAIQTSESVREAFGLELSAYGILRYLDRIPVSGNFAKNKQLVLMQNSQGTYGTFELSSSRVNEWERDGRDLWIPSGRVRDLFAFFKVKQKAGTLNPWPKEASRLLSSG